MLSLSHTVSRRFGYAIGQTGLLKSSGLPIRRALPVSCFRAYSIAVPKSGSEEDDRPLAGIKVVDLTRVLAGPLATMMLSDLGADVIKIESPQGGDDTRSWLPPFAPIPSYTNAMDGTSQTIVPRPDLPPESAYFLQANRNKRSLTLNLKSHKGQEVVQRLIKEADVLVENYVPGKLAKFGLDYESVSAINPRLVYCSITGYGSTGPYASNPGYDVVIEAEAGLMHITGEKDGRPVKVGVAVTDILTGHYAQSGILSALLRRGRTGKGGRVETSLFESQIASLANIASNYLIAGTEATRWGTAHPSIVPYQVFATADGYLMLAAGNDNQFRTLCSESILNRPDWVQDERFKSNSRRVENRGEMIRLIEGALADKGTQAWCEVLKGKGLPFAPINNIAQTFAHPQAIAREVVQEIDHPRAGKIKLSAPAVTYDGQKPKIYRPPPYLGQHTDEVLSEIGYTVEEIQDMRNEGVV